MQGSQQLKCSDTYSVDNLLVLVAALVDFDEGEVVKLPLVLAPHHPHGPDPGEVAVIGGLELQFVGW